MANSTLQGKSTPIPLDVINFLETYCNETKNNCEIAQKLVANKNISYEYAKKIKNFFDNYQGSNNEHDYLVRGGDKMKSFINNWLNSQRSSIHNSKKIKKDNFISNSFKKSHEKDKSSNINEPIKPISKFTINETQLYLLKNARKRTQRT